MSLYLITLLGTLGLTVAAIAVAASTNARKELVLIPLVHFGVLVPTLVCFESWSLYEFMRDWVVLDLTICSACLLSAKQPKASMSLFAINYAAVAMFGCHALYFAISP